MRRLQILGPVVLALPLAALPVTPASAATSWKTIVQVNKVQSQACKVSVGAGKPWRVRVRLVNGSREVYTAGWSVYRGDTKLRSVNIKTSGPSTSKVRTFRVERGAGITLSAGIGNDEGGLGDSDVFDYVGRC